jgi:hypothetical protein
MKGPTIFYGEVEKAIKVMRNKKPIGDDDDDDGYDDDNVSGIVLIVLG